MHFLNENAEFAKKHTKNQVINILPDREMLDEKEGSNSFQANWIDFLEFEPLQLQ